MDIIKNDLVVAGEIATAFANSLDGAANWGASLIRRQKLAVENKQNEFFISENRYSQSRKVH